MKRYFWLAVRLAVVGYWTLYGWFAAREDFPFQPSPVLPVFAFLLGFVFTRFLVLRNYRKLGPGVPWQRPSWLARPFQIEQPFQFLHLAGYSLVYYVVAAGLRWNLVHDRPIPTSALLGGALGAGVIAGITFAVAAHRERFSKVPITG